ncbi:MAG TPA: hypothetical protein VKA27_01575 [Sunxiuqinia sp.]|nr:hypothetical protein [Sunxiuqinia sp.]
MYYLPITFPDYTQAGSFTMNSLRRAAFHPAAAGSCQSCLTASCRQGTSACPDRSGKPDLPGSLLLPAAFNA